MNEKLNRKEMETNQNGNASNNFKIYFICQDSHSTWSHQFLQIKAGRNDREEMELDVKSHFASMAVEALKSRRSF